MGIADIRETIASCKHCFMCRHACPTFLATKLDSHTPRGYALLLAEIESGKIGWSDAVVERFYQCTQCGLCREDCAYHWPEDELVRNAREDIVKDDAAPVRVNEIARGFIDRGYPESGNTLPQINGAVFGKANAEILYYSGWSTRMFQPAVAQSMVLLLSKLGADWTMMEHEMDTGISLFELGFTSEAHTQATMLRDQIANMKPRQIITGCAHSYRAFRHQWKEMGVELGADIEILHTTEFLSRIIDRGALTVRESAVEGPVGYHDPCQLARHEGVLEEPRNVIKALTGRDPVELFHDRRQAECCGAGSIMFLSDPDISLKIAARRLSLAREDGVRTLVTACPNCRTIFGRAAEKFDININLVDIAELFGLSLKQ
jgi:Fe-S oxidoreductase